MEFNLIPASDVDFQAWIIEIIQPWVIKLLWPSHVRMDYMADVEAGGGIDMCGQ